MEPTVNRIRALRRLGRTWNYPEDREFVAEYLAGLIPTCVDCGRPIITHLESATRCDPCDDWRALEDKNRYYDVVLVSEEYGFRLWAWYPDPAGMTDMELLRLWRNVPHFGRRRSNPFQTLLGGYWNELSTEGWHQIRNELFESGPLRSAHIHEDNDSALYIHYPDYFMHPDGSVGGTRMGLHAAHPNRRG